MSVEDKSEVKEGTSITLTGQAVGRNINSKTEKLKMHYTMTDKSNGNVVDTKLADGVMFNKGVATDPNPRIFKLDKAGSYKFTLKVTHNVSGSPKTAPGSEIGNCKKRITVKKDLPCIDVSNDDDATACLILSKRAQNDTQDISDADGTTARANDKITYNLFVKNTSNNTAVKGFQIEENITDVLEYSDIVDLHGGTINDENIVKWPKVDIDVGATVQRQITVMIKDPLPQTPVSSSNPGSFDCVMTNVYSDTVNIKLKCGAAKTTEQVSTALPNTGPGETLAVAFVVTVVGGYFLARTKLMATELDIIKSEYTSGGGN